MTEPAVARIHLADDVVIARRQLVGGMRLDAEGITVIGLVPPGHKLAVRAIAQGEPVRCYNQIIGTATQLFGLATNGQPSTPNTLPRASLPEGLRAVDNCPNSLTKTSSTKDTRE